MSAAFAADPIPGPNAAALQAIPGVTATVHPARNGRTQRIIHIKDRHFVREAEFAVEGDAEGYETFLAQVEAVQAEQCCLLRDLIKHHGLKAVHVEGLTQAILADYYRRIETLRRFEQTQPTGDTAIDLLLLREHRLDRLEIGAAGRLGTLVFDESKNADREDAIVRQLAKQKVDVVILGGGHDLTDNADRVCGGMCEVFFTVTTDAYRRVAERSAGN